MTNKNKIKMYTEDEFFGFINTITAFNRANTNVIRDEIHKFRESGKNKCQKVNTQYCKCDCGKHKQNGDY